LREDVFDVFVLDGLQPNKDLVGNVSSTATGCDTKNRTAEKSELFNGWLVVTKKIGAVFPGRMARCKYQYGSYQEQGMSGIMISPCHVPLCRYEGIAKGNQCEKHGIMHFANADR
jgi:hypothetical protein